MSVLQNKQYYLITVKPYNPTIYMNETINKRVEALRAVMSREDEDACIFSSTEQEAGEAVAVH